MYMPKILYLVVAYFMRYHTLTSISHGRRFHKILHKNCNISRLQFSWDITPESKYLMVADFMRYYTRTTKKHGCRFHNILQPNLNISWLHISWDITPYQNPNIAWLHISWDIAQELQYLMVADLIEIFHQDHNISWLQI